MLLIVAKIDCYCMRNCGEIVRPTLTINIKKALLCESILTNPPNSWIVLYKPQNWMISGHATTILPLKPDLDFLLESQKYFAGYIILIFHTFWCWTRFSKNKFFFDPFLFMRFNCLSATEPLLRDSLISALSPQEFLLLIWLTWGKWKAESTLKSPCDFETWTLGLEIQRPNH